MTLIWPAFIKPRLHLAGSFFFYNSTQNKSLLQGYCFQPLCNDWDEGVFYRVVSMENLAVTDVIKGLCLTLSAVQAWPERSVVFLIDQTVSLGQTASSFCPSPLPYHPLSSSSSFFTQSAINQQDAESQLKLRNTDGFVGHLVSISHLIGGLFRRLWSDPPARCCYRKRSSTNFNPYLCLLNCTRASVSITAVVFKRNEGILMLGCIFYQINTQFN